jgi:hypothetical protein
MHILEAIEIDRTLEDVLGELCPFLFVEWEVHLPVDPLSDGPTHAEVASRDEIGTQFLPECGLY